MKKVIDFIKSNPVLIKWTIWYFFILWAILKYIFRFDMFSAHYWWKFFHATLHGFAGFVFGSLVYSAIPIYIATMIITYRKQELIIPIPFEKKLSALISKIFAKKAETPAQDTTPTEEEKKTEENTGPEFPADLPHEMRVPFMRAKNRMPLNGAVSVYNKTNIQPTAAPVPTPEAASENSDMPIPMDFDISDNTNETINDSIPTFTDIDFDTPIATEKELCNNTTKYMNNHNIEYETYHDFVATERFVIYEHSDEEFWIMEGDSWFAAGKQKDSPVAELIDLAKQNDLTPVIYLHSTNIMDIDNVIKNFETSGIRVVKDLDELK